MHPMKFAIALSCAALFITTPSLAAPNLQPQHHRAVQKNITITGNIAYLQRIALPKDAIVKVELQDISLADAPAITLAKQQITPHGKQVPIPFKLTAKRSVFIPNMRYTISVRIENAAGALLWITDAIYPVNPPANGAKIDMGTIILHQV